MVATREFLITRCKADLPRLGAAAAAYLDSPEDAEARETLLRALRASVPRSAYPSRKMLLDIVLAHPNDVDLLNESLRALYSLLDAQGLAAMRAVAKNASDPNASLWARLHLAKSLSAIGKTDEALAAFGEHRSGDTVVPRVASHILNLELYSSAADDMCVARIKEANLRRIRAQLPPGLSAPVRRRDRPRLRVGLVSGCFQARNYTSLMVPFLRELASGDLDVELLSLTSDRLDHVRATLPERIEVRELCVLSPATVSQPEAWAAAHEALVARELDLLVDVDESLAPHSPACVAGRPAPVQATWFNMSGPSSDPCFDAAIGPDTLYPPELDAAFPGRIARLAGDLYVFEPEVWEQQGFSLPAAGPPPILRNGYPTFGSLSNLYKISDACVALWARVLRAVPNARLYLGNEMAYEQVAIERLRALFEREGIDMARIDIRYHFVWPDYLAGYSNIDIVLGSYPVAGGTTLFEALHMGMPVLSRVGRTSLGRIGRWLAAAVGRPNLAHDTDESLVAEAARLAGAPAELERLRREEPTRLRAKSRTDAVRMARAFESIARKLAA
jgi:predicted O-linked N-acetylglucosamine transferase (SPINDLY family)